MSGLNFDLIYQALKKEKVISLPTDTVPGIVAIASSDKALQEVYRIKNRSINKPFSLLVANIKMADELIFLNSKSVKFLMADFSITILGISKFSNKISRYVNLKNQLLAVRIPKDDFLIKLINKLEAPLVATSLNLSGDDDAINFFKNNNSPFIKNYPIMNSPSPIINPLDGKILRANSKQSFYINNEI